MADGHYFISLLVVLVGLLILLVSISAPVLAGMIQ